MTRASHKAFLEDLVVSTDDFDRAYGRLLATSVMETLFAWAVDEVQRGDGLGVEMSNALVRLTTGVLTYFLFVPPGSEEEVADQIAASFRKTLVAGFKKRNEPRR